MCIRSYIDKKLYEQNSYSREDSIPIPLCEAWCKNCHSKTEVESIPTIAKILEVIEQAKAASTEPIIAVDYFDESKTWNKVLTEDQKQRDIKGCLKVLEWRKKRKSPRKCLECGSTKIVELKESEHFEGFDNCNIITYYDFEGNKL